MDRLLDRLMHCLILYLIDWFQNRRRRRLWWFNPWFVQYRLYPVLGASFWNVKANFHKTSQNKANTCSIKYIFYQIHVLSNTFSIKYMFYQIFCFVFHIQAITSNKDLKKKDIDDWIFEKLKNFNLKKHSILYFESLI